VAASSAYSGLAATSSVCVPAAWTRPESITMIRSASMTVDSRCATTSTVITLATSATVSRSAASLMASSWEVASSSSSNRGRRSSARAIAIRCRSPPDSRIPRCPTKVSSPSGRRSVRSESLVVRRTSASSPSVAPGAPNVRFSRMVPDSTGASCST
jgi:hypothetical protein